MIHKLSWLFFLCFYGVTLAQSTDLDRERFSVSYVKLPKSPILEDSKRTYSSNSDHITISGLSKLVSGGTLDIVYREEDITIGDVDIKEYRDEDKDRDGNVTSVTYSYSVIVVYTTSATASIHNEITGETYPHRISERNVYESRRFNSHSRASNYYENNRFGLRNNHRSQQRDQLRFRMRSFLDDKYGYTAYNTKTEHFWILGSKRHPEFSKHHEAYNQLKALFSTMKYDQPMDSIATQAQPIIAYFESIIPKYTGTKRRARKIRYASYYNIAKLYYYLDDVENTRAYGQKIIDNDYDKGDGKYFIKLANKLQKKFETNNINTRHFEILTEDLSNIPSTDTTPNFDKNEEGTAQKDDDILAYLITKSNDTLQGYVSGIPGTITYGVTLKTISANGAPKSTYFKAEECETLALTNEDLYKEVVFTPASPQGKDKNAPKLAKQLYDSERIQLYLFGTKEYVLKFSDQERGVSTLLPAFAFGFNKKLASYCSDCPSVLKRTQQKEFKNNEESLLSFCAAYAKECK